ncbi:hypothetical protein HAX54_035461, partial [Datura stramonium]|nr:hypothetical protein [Datura stramonium]
SGLLDIDEARLCLCVRRLAVGKGLSQCLVNRRTTIVVFDHAKSLMCWVFVSIGTFFGLAMSASAATLDPCLSSNVLTRMPSHSWGACSKPNQKPLLCPTSSSLSRAMSWSMSSCSDPQI